MLGLLTFVWDTLSVTRWSFDVFIYAQVIEKPRDRTASPERPVPLASMGHMATVTSLSVSGTRSRCPAGGLPFQALEFPPGSWTRTVLDIW